MECLPQFGQQARHYLHAMTDRAQILPDDKPSFKRWHRKFAGQLNLAEIELVRELHNTKRIESRSAKESRAFGSLVLSRLGLKRETVSRLVAR